MRLSAVTLANTAAWVVFLLLAAAAVKLTLLLGPVSLAILGAATWLICSRAALDEDAAGSGTEVFRARMTAPRSIEERAARHAERQGFQDSLRFFGRCGMALLAIGIAGLCCQAWQP